MLDYIEQLRQKPEATRRRVLYVSVTVIMAVIILLWIATFPFRFDNTTAEGKQENPSPFAVWGEYMQGWYADFSRGVDRIQERF